MRLVKKDEHTYYLVSASGTRAVRREDLERYLNQSLMISKLAARRLVKAADERYKQQAPLGVVDAAGRSEQAG